MGRSVGRGSDRPLRGAKPTPEGYDAVMESSKFGELSGRGHEEPQHAVRAVTLCTCALAHAAVDATCAALVFGAAASGRATPQSAGALFLLYNVVAFASQPLFGLAVDRLAALRAAAVVGGVMTALALPLSLVPGMVLAATVMAGLGNGLFHVGGGAISIRVSPGRAWAPGLFVAPGAAGLVAGMLLGRAGGPLWIPTTLLLALSAGLLLVRIPSLHGTREPSAPPRGAEFAIALVLVVIALRSFTGLAIVLPWKSSVPLLGWLTAAVVAGKALGGVMADRFGRLRIGVGALVISAPLLVAAYRSPVAGVLGMLAFNVTMAVTLVAVADALPGQPAFAFGLASFALVIGALPVLLGMSVGLATADAIVGAVGLAAVLLGLALVWLDGGARVDSRCAPSVVEVSE